MGNNKFENFLIAKNDLIDNAAFELITALISTSNDEENEEVEWNMEHIGEVVDMVKSYLEEQGFQVCHPYYEADMNTDEKPCCECDSCFNKNCQMRKN